MKKQVLKMMVLCLLGVNLTLSIQAQNFAKNKFSSNQYTSAIGGIPDPPPDTPIDSNLYVLFFAALCYGVCQRKRFSREVVRG